MDLTQLRYFITLTNTLNFREASRRLNVSQSSVSRQILELERRLGVQLFRRTSRSVSLTEEGAVFLPYALDIIGTAESAEFLMERFHKGASGHLFLSALTTSSAFLTAALDVFFKKYPDVIVDVSLKNASDQQNAMTDNKYDFHFAHMGMLPPDGRLEWLVTHRDSMALVVPRDHPLAGKPLDFAALTRERFIVSMEPGNPLLYTQIMKICAAHDFSPNVMNRYDNVESVLLAISAGLGVSIMPAALPKVFFADSVAVIPIEDMDTSRTYIAAWPKDASNPASKLFLEVLRDCAEPS